MSFCCMMVESARDLYPLPTGTPDASMFSVGRSCRMARFCVPIRTVSETTNSRDLFGSQHQKPTALKTFTYKPALATVH
jgi:hypothetical protein